MEPLSRDEMGAALEVVAEDLEGVERIMFDASTAGTSFLTEATTYLTKAGGKRLRPALTVLAARLGRGVDLGVLLAAASIEMTHMATLYHDDVIDEADVRRGVPSVNEKWGNTVSILAGDYLFARASSLASEVGGEVPRILADAVSRVVEGQVRELESAYDPRRSTEHYLETIRRKTASLLEASTRIGARLGACPDRLVEVLGEFGVAFGFAFQVADDLLDLAAGQDELGKPPGTDLRDGVYTLPVIFAVEAEPDAAELLGGPNVDLDKVREIVFETGAFGRALAFAGEHVDRSLALLAEAPAGPARTALEQITRLTVARVPAPAPSEAAGE